LRDAAKQIYEAQLNRAKEVAAESRPPWPARLSIDDIRACRFAQ
jgi:hypothetical protein